MCMYICLLACMYVQDLFLFSVYECLPTCMCVLQVHGWCPWGPEKCVGSLCSRNYRRFDLHMGSLYC